MKKAEIVFIPLPEMGHVVPTVEIAKLIVELDDRISTSVLIMRPTVDSSTNKYTESLITSTLSNRMRVVALPSFEPAAVLNTGAKWMTFLVEAQKPHVKEFVTKIKTQSALSPDSPRLAAFVFDNFVTGMNSLAEEFGVPWYGFSAASAAFLGSMFHLQFLHDEQKVDLTEFENSEAELEIPGLANRFPAKLLPAMVFDDSLSDMLEAARNLRGARGIFINTFQELESNAVNSLSNAKIPPVYPVGPIVKRKGNVGSDQSNNHKDIMQWLDDQLPSSVVFLCFGSWGGFCVDQVKEIACALELCGHRFLWSLRNPPLDGKIEPPSDCESYEEILPKGFLDRMINIGKVIGWAPQTDILAHPAIGGFASHCGWNSILESIWHGVPIATWPIYAEQQLNAFKLVVELGLAVEIKMDYKKNLLLPYGNEEIVRVEDIKKGLNFVMEQDCEIRKKVKEMSQISRKVLTNDGSSYFALTCVIKDMTESIARDNCS